MQKNYVSAGVFDLNFLWYTGTVIYKKTSYKCGIGDVGSYRDFKLERINRDFVCIYSVLICDSIVLKQ